MRALAISPVVALGLLAVIAVAQDPAAKNQKPQNPPAATHALRWNQLPRTACGVDVYRTKYPERDGRGVVIAVLDTGVDMAVKGLDRGPDGAAKVIDVRDFSGEGDVELHRGRFLNGGKQVGRTAEDGTPENYGAPDRGKIGDAAVWLATIKESRFKNTRVADVDDDGKKDGVFAVCVLAPKDAGDDHALVFVDTDGDRDFSDEKPVRNFHVAQETFTFHRKNEARQRRQLTCAVNVFLKKRLLSVHFDSGGHGTHVAGIAAGYKLHGQDDFHGIAPGAKVISLKIGDNRLAGGSTTTGSKKAAFLYAARYAREKRVPVVCNLSYGIASEQEGAADIDRFLDKLLSENPFLIICQAAGNEGPGLSSIGSPAAAHLPITVGAMMAKETAKSVMGAKLAHHQIARFSSRGGELSKPDIVTPGAVTSAVPLWNRDGDFWWGTSMASPYAAGLCGLLAGDLHAESPGRQPFHTWIKEALQKSGRSVPGFERVDIGAGLPELSAAVAELRELAAAHGDSPFLDYAIRTESPMAPGGEGRAAYWRTEHLPRGQIQEFHLKPIFAPHTDRARQGGFARRYRLRSTASWCEVMSDQVYFRGPQEATVRVRYKDGAFQSPGVYQASVELLEGDAVVTRLWNTVVVPHTFSAENGYRRSFKNQAADGWRPQRYFVAVPAGAGAMQVDLRAVDGQFSTARVGQIFRPNGTAIWAGRLNLETKTGKTSARREIVDGLRPGVWEICVTSDRPDEVSRYELAVSFTGLAAVPSEITSWSHGVGKTPSGSVKVRNLFAKPVRGKLSGSLMGYRKTVKRKLTAKNDTAKIPVTFAKGVSAVRVRSKIKGREYALVTDLAVTMREGGNNVFQAGFPDRTFDRRIDSPKDGAKCQLEIMGAFTHADGDAKIELEVELEYLYASPVPIRVTSNGKSEVVFYPGIDVDLDFELASVPPKTPDGCKPSGELTISEKATGQAALSISVVIGG